MVLPIIVEMHSFRVVSSYGRGNGPSTNAWICLDLSGISGTGSRRLGDKRKSIWFVGHTEAMG
jgi:hypothetical protein